MKCKVFAYKPRRIWCWNFVCARYYYFPIVELVKISYRITDRIGEIAATIDL